MGMFQKTLRFGGSGSIWRAVKPRSEIAGVAWFIGRFITAADVVARRWGPRWTRERLLLGRAVGAWVLLALWIGVPGALVFRRVLRLAF